MALVVSIPWIVIFRAGGCGRGDGVPVGKLGEDRYLPLHPQLVTLIDHYGTRHVSPDHPLLLPRENGRPLDRHTVTRMINRAGTAAGRIVRRIDRRTGVTKPVWPTLRAPARSSAGRSFMGVAGPARGD